MLSTIFQHAKVAKLSLLSMIKCYYSIININHFVHRDLLKVVIERKAIPALYLKL